MPLIHTGFWLVNIKHRSQSHQDQGRGMARPGRLCNLLLLQLLLLLGGTHGTPIEDIATITTSTALAAVMYRDMKGTGGCYKLLNATGRIGSQGDVTVLVPVKQSVAFMQQLSADTVLQQHIKGILIDDTDAPSSYSTVGGFPLAEYAPYKKQWDWNKAAGANAYPFSSSWYSSPVFLLTPEMAADARERAAYNAKQSLHRRQYHARLKLTMTAAVSNSTACIADDTCKPLGGYSVWAAMPPLPPPATGPVGDQRPIILVVAQMDSIDMFHDSIQGADAPLSGLVAMLGALKVLHDTASVSSYTKRIVFLALAGEPWGYMGSRRLLFEAATGSNNTAGLELSLVEKVLEIGQVGRLPGISPTNPAASLFVHFQRDVGFGDSSSVVAALTAAAQGEAAEAKVAVKEADPSNPGIPPASLMSFLRINSSVQGVVLTEFDQAYTNPYYASRFDNGSTINVEGIAATSALLAGALHRLAGGDPTAFKLNLTDVQEAVSAYTSCIMMPVPGYSCPLATSLMTPSYAYNPATKARSYAPLQYIGVMPYVPEVQSPVAKSNLARLLWNIMAFATSSSTAESSSSCDPFETRCPAGQVCAGWRSSDNPTHMGKCLAATVQYVPSYSTRLACTSCDEWWSTKWYVSQDADAWNELYGWPPDPVWAESDWPQGVPALQLYLHEAGSVEVAVLVAGILVTAAVAVATYLAKAAFERHLKSS